MSFTPLSKEQLLEQYRDTLATIRMEGTAVSAADLYHLINLDMELTRMGVPPVVTLPEPRTAQA